MTKLNRLDQALSQEVHRLFLDAPNTRWFVRVVPLHDYNTKNNGDPKITIISFSLVGGFTYAAPEEPYQARQSDQPNE